MKGYEYRENYVRKLIRNERNRRNNKPVHVYSGICSESVYARLENGDFNVNFHIRRAIMQRLGIDGSRCGVYLTAKECAELDKRAEMLENIAQGRLKAAGEQLDTYRKTYSMKNKLNMQFVCYVSARLEELEGNKADAFELYDRAISLTMPDYAEREKDYECVSIYEAYIICNSAKMRAQHGDTDSAAMLYNKLIEYCKKGCMDKWSLCRIYPAAVCGLMKITYFEELQKHQLCRSLSLCYAAIESLRDTGRLYFLTELLNYVKVINGLCSNKEDTECIELTECLTDLYSEYDVHMENYEWYPYYIEGRYYPVEKVINERRIMYGMTIEELAGTDCDVSTVSRIINGKNTARINTVNMLLDKLGFTAALDSDVIVSEDSYVHALWDEFVHVFLTEDYDTAEKVYSELAEKLDMTIEINRTAVEFIRIKLDLDEGKIDREVAMKKYTGILPFPICDIGKYKYYTVIEQNAIDCYISCMEEVDRKESVKMLQIRYDKYNNVIEEKQDVMIYEYILRKYSSILGNSGEYWKSNYIAKEGVILELLCSRAYVLDSFLYDIAWNNAQRGTLSKKDIKLCRYAYLVACFKKDKRKIKFYKTKYELYCMLK